MDGKKYFDIFRGKFESVVEDKSKIVKIFLSSTFSDSHSERDYLIKNVYPKLREYCQKTYGLEFQVYDMRWGISHEITNSHMATTVCLNEIKNCQNSSVGPNFIALLSKRYGSRSLPTRVKAYEYEILMNELISTNDYEKSFIFEEKEVVIRVENMLKFCYELDDNETPARYRLKHIDKIIQNFTENDSILNKAWNKLEKKLGNLFRALAENCLMKNLITPVEHERYFVSVTEKEIFNGILKAKNVEKKVLYFEREIEDLDESIEKNVSMAKRFTELDKNNCVDKEVRNLLDDLKYKKIPSKLPESNMFKFKVKWDSKSGISLDTHREYIEKFAETFYEQVKKLIDLNYEEQKKFDDLSHEDHELIQEVIDHACFCNETVSKFHGRADILHKIQKYLLDTSNNIPYILYGESGCGKTAILAKITSEIFKIVPDPENYCVLLRFLGTTPISSDIIKTFQSLMRQLCRIFSIQKNEFKAKNEIEAKDNLENLLDFIANIYPNKKIVIVLDSIDQLNSSFYSLNWLISLLNRNVKVIYSTLPNHGNILDILKKRLDYQKHPNNFEELKSLDAKLAEEIVLDWLGKIERKITNSQLSVIRELFSNAILYPLYVKLIFDIVSKWTSFYEPDNEFKNCLDIDSSIKFIFLSLEQVHGKLLFSRTIIYMSLFKNGISENEIEDILSLDDDVLYDIFEFHAPPIRKLPIALWARIKNDLKEYMVEKEIDDTRVIYWYHRRFIEVANSHYVSKLYPENRTGIFTNVIDFFNETWKHKPKPYIYNDYLSKKFGVKNGETEEVRDTGMQPTVFFEPDGKIRYNKRKISELPAFIGNLTANLAINLACDLVFFDLNFLTGLFSHLSLVDIFEHLAKISEVSTYSISEESRKNLEQLKIFRLCLLQCGVQMKDNPEGLMIHFLSRSLNFYKHLGNFTKIIDQYYAQSPKYFPLILAHQFMQPPIGELIFQLDKHSAPITHTVIGGDNDSLILSLSNKIYAFNMSTVLDLGSIKFTDFIEEIIFFTAYVDKLEENFSSLNEINGGIIVCSLSEVIVLNFDSSIKFSVRSGHRKIDRAFPINENFLLIFYYNENFIELYNMENNELFEKISFDHKIIYCYSSVQDGLIIDIHEPMRFAICFDNFQVKIFSPYFENNTLKLNILNSLPNCGFELAGVQFTEHSDKSILFFSMRNIGFLFLDLDKNLITFYLSLKKVLNLKLLQWNGTIHLLIGENKSLFLLNNEFAYEIKGNYTNGCLTDQEKLIGIQEGSISIFKYSFEKNILKLIKTGYIDAHYDKIVFIFPKDELLLTTSRDSSLKVFSTNMIKDLSELKLDFDKASLEVYEIIYIQEFYLISMMKQYNQLHVWNKMNGKIEFNLILDPIENINQIKCSASKAIVVSKLDEKTYRIRYFSIKIDEKIALDEKMRKDLTNIDEIMVEYDADRDDLFFLIASNGKLNVISYNLNQINSSFANQSIDLAQLAIDSLNLNINLSAITLQNKLLAFAYEQSLHYFDISNGKLIKSKNFQEQSMNIEYFLNPTNMPLNSFKYLSAIENSDNLVMLDNMGNIHFVLNCYKSNEIKTFRSKDFVFESFKLNKDKVLGCDVVNFKLVCFDLKRAKENNSFNNSFFTIDFAKSNIDKDMYHYGLSLSNKNIYLIENKKNLRFFDVINTDEFKAEQTANLTLYAEATSVLCSNEFISLSMKDRKVISFLISDKENLEETYKRIKNLPHFGKLNKETEMKNSLIINKCKTVLDDSSDEDIDFDELFEDENDEENRKKMKRLEMQEIDPLDIIYKSKKTEKLRQNWVYDILIKDMGFNVKQYTNEISPDQTIEEYSSETCIDFEMRKEIIDILLHSNKNTYNKNTGQNVTVANNYSSKSCLIQ